MRIYDGFRFASCDLLAIHGQLTAFRPVLDGLAREATCRFLATEATRLIDRRALRDEPPGSPLAESFDALQGRQRKIRTTGRRDPVVDHEFVVRILPFEDRIYGLLVSEQVPWKEAFPCQVDVEEFAYWDGDPPEGLSCRDWAERRGLWRRLLGQDPAMRPAGCGFAMDFLTSLDWPDPSAILSHVPDRAGRVAASARSRLLDASLEPRQAELQAGGISAVMAALSEAETALRDDPVARATLAEETLRIEEILPVVTADLLLGAA